MRRQPGTGSVTHRGGDRYLLRLPTAAGDRATKTIRAESPEAAEAQLDNLLAVLAKSGQMAVGGVTFRGYLSQWLDRCDREGGRSRKTYRSRAECYLETARWADDLAANITPGDVRDHVRFLLESKLGPSTVSAALSLLRSVLGDAVEDGIIATNPAHGVQLPRDARKRKAKDRRKARNPLTRDELVALLVCDKLSLCDRAMIATGALCGLRAGEVYGMPLDHVAATDGLLMLDVEFGGYGGAPTKSDERRQVPALGAARELLEAWLAAVPRSKARNPEGLLFPGLGGGRRSLSHASSWLEYRMRLAGLSRAVRFHDLRHTAATALENGWFGPPMAREHVQAVLGHSSIVQTEHYSGGATEAMLRAARAWTAAAESTGPEDQGRISGPANDAPKAAKKLRSGTTARRTRRSSDLALIPGGSVDSDPVLILQDATERLVLACAERTATADDVEAWAALVVEHTPDPWRGAREILAGEVGAPHAVARALESARALLKLLAVDGMIHGDYAGATERR